MKRGVLITLFILIVISLIGFVSSITFTEHVVASSFSAAYTVHAADMDNDGDIDILGGAILGNEISWWENDGNEGFTKKIVDSSFNAPRSVYALDVDKDGDTDVIGSQSNQGQIAWWENDGNEVFIKHLIKSQVGAVDTIYPSDINNDGYIDIVAVRNAITPEITWWKNNGDKTFTQNIFANYYAASVFAIDLDDDGDNDILAALFSNGEAAWWKNDGSGNFGTKNIIGSGFLGISSIFATNLDDDEDKDVLTADDIKKELAWWENDGNEVFTKHIIDSSFDFYQSSRSIFAADMDNDGDIDVIGSGEDQNEIAWWENDGNEIFTKHHIDSSPTPGVFNCEDIYIIDVDKDGDIDVLGTWYNTNEIVLYENLPPSCYNLKNLSVCNNISLQEEPVLCAWKCDNGPCPPPVLDTYSKNGNCLDCQEVSDTCSAYNNEKTCNDDPCSKRTQDCRAVQCNETREFKCFWDSINKICKFSSCIGDDSCTYSSEVLQNCTMDVRAYIIKYVGEPAITCVSKEVNAMCKNPTMLSFFTWINIIAVIVILIGVYYIYAISKKKII